MKTVLIVEKDEDTSLALQAVFRKRGYETKVFSDHKEATECIKSGLNYDLIIADTPQEYLTRMPDNDFQPLGGALDTSKNYRRVPRISQSSYRIGPESAIFHFQTPYNIHSLLSLVDAII